MRTRSVAAPKTFTTLKCYIIEGAMAEVAAKLEGGMKREERMRGLKILGIKFEPT